MHLSGKPTSKRVLPREPWKTTTLIGRVWKRGDARSLPVLIARLSLIALIYQRPSQSLRIIRKPLRSFRKRMRQGRDRKTSAKGAHLLRCVSPAWWPSAKRSDPIPSRTRPSNASAPMVLCLKTWESRSSPGLPNTSFSSSDHTHSAAQKRRFLASRRGVEQPGSSSGS
jgi:hypothetical protein